jgi:uncharacterized membrane protein
LSGKIYNSQEYIRKLDRLLKKLPPDERNDAVRYYAEYLADAGPEREAEAISGLGSPAQVASGIKADAAMRQLEEGKPRMRTGISAVWLAVLGVFALPIALPLAIAGFAVVFSVLVSVFAVLFSLIVSMASLFLSGIVTAVCGFAVLPQSFATGLFYIGGGLACTAIGFLLGILFWQLLRVTLKGVARLFNKIRYRKINKTAAKNAATIMPGYGVSGSPGNQVNPANPGSPVNSGGFSTQNPINDNDMERKEADDHE